MFYNLKPSPLLVSDEHVSVDWVIQVMLYTVLNPLGVWVYVGLMYLRTGEIQHVRFGLAVVIAWILRYYNWRSRKCRFSRRNRRNIVVTGGSHGLGLELVRLLSSSCQIWVLDHEMSVELGQLAQHQKSVAYVQCDLGSQTDLDSAIDTLFQRTDQIDAVVCNAGIRQSKQTLHLSSTELQKLFDINYFANVHLVKRVLKAHTHPNRLHLVCVSSVLGIVSPRGLSGYSATKAAMYNFFTSLRHETPESVVVSTVVPGQLTTRMFNDVKVDHFFWAPLIDHRKLAVRITEVLDQGVNGVFAYPLYGRLLPVLQILPYSWYRWLKKYSRMDDVIES
ncbi:hypothetical protein OGAPHI_003912 [Ogataea philodendri]|uniref:Uncharacterized protein n=1 Tax=Ogataea philodendri TaxID=1378263 RepID=A0A9P8P696_9ASCO|nr:uncharacterized protein OGAPHI_003912 [Ogataea philodendri]KAH3665724.1 hypothetical protein OGAPHI_003912 [Ogataea philodendri]